MKLAGHQIITKLHESGNSLVYRARRETDRQPVILKVLKGDYPSPQRVAWFKREYELMRSLDVDGVVDVYSLDNVQNRWLILLEDFGGESLVRLNLIGRLNLADFLTLAIQVTDILGRIHRHRIIHKDINPSNIVAVPPAGGRMAEEGRREQEEPAEPPDSFSISRPSAVDWDVKLIDFGIATVLSQETLTFRNPNVLEGTLAYVSPEQTGRMNRPIDYRTDFYSLGATFYELLTGQPPFATTDPLELVHSHIARLPRPPHEINPAVPPVLSEIVLKLMAKNTEDRYQTAHGLQADLMECLWQFEANEQIDPFPLGQADLSDRFQLPQKLYGRDHQISQVLAAFDRVAGPAGEEALELKAMTSSEIEDRKSKVEMVLVTGQAGIGKSVLVQETFRPITGRHGYFIAGKFDQFQRNIPYASLIQAFRSLVRQLLTESDEEIAVWREKLLAALGPNGRVIIEVIPEVKLITGPQPPVPQLGPAEAQNRFNLVFENFIRVFTQPEHPLTLFLDDLQWADGASLKLLELLMTTPDSHDLLLLGAYRDNEVGPAHPLRLTLAEIEQAGATLDHLSLEPLTLPDIADWLADTFHCPPEQADPLAELVLAKTGGNPFFIGEFLKSLHAEGLVYFVHPDSVDGPAQLETDRGRWQWDLGQIRSREITDNVVDLLAARVLQLPGRSQQVLKLAACIGNQFDLETLAVVSEQSRQGTAAALWPALETGLVLPLNDAYKLTDLDLPGLAEEVTAEYKFAHDRIQQAVYSLIPEEDKQAVHWRVGHLLLQNIAADRQEQHIFDIVNQLNQGRTLAAQQTERTELVRLNLMAGRKAKASSAYQPAFDYLQVGLELLAESDWQDQYDLSLGLTVEAAEVAYLNGQFEEMERLSQIVLQQAQTVLDKIKVYEVKIQGYHAQLKLLEAVKTGLQALELLGISFPEQPGPEDIMGAMQETGTLLAGRRIESLIDLPAMTDPTDLAAMRIISSVFGAAYVAMNMLIPLFTCKQVNLSVEKGNAADSAHAYVLYGMMLCSGGDIDAGYQFGQLALQVLDRFNAKELKAKTYLFANGFLIHWKRALRDILPALREAYQSGLETGDLESTANAAATYAINFYLAGHELAEVEKEIATYGQAIAQCKQEAILHWLQTYWQAVLNLRDQSENPTRLSGDVYNEDQMLPLHQEVQDNAALWNLYFNKVILAYLFQEVRPAFEALVIVQPYFEQLTATMYYAPPFHLYDSLVRLALYPEASESERAEILEKVAANQEKLETWAGHAPANCLHKFHLVEAERARVLGEVDRAAAHYDQAIDLAQEHRYLNEEALAYELAGRFYLAQDQTRPAQYYLRDALYAYRRWGALAKVKDLEERYQHLLAGAGTDPAAVITTTTATTTTTGTRRSGALDLNSVLKASQAISGEIVLDTLLARLMKVIIENAGAQRGYLLLEKDGRWAIEAEAQLDAPEAEARTEPEVTTRQAIPVSLTGQEEAGAIKGTSVLPRSVVNYVVRTRESVVLNDAARESPFTQDGYVSSHQPKSVLCTPLINRGRLAGILYLENNLTTGAFTPDRLELLNLLSAQAAISLENARLYDYQVSLTQSYSRFVPPEYLTFLQKGSITQVDLGDHVSKEMAVLFSDIRTFTALSETMSPQENFNFVNAYFKRVSPVIRDHGGFIVKYLGDGMMAVFPDSANDAIRAGIEKLKRVEQYNLGWEQEGWPPIAIGVGVHVGHMMVGIIGEANRMQGDAFSDNVNLTARIEDLTKFYQVPFIITEEALAQLSDPDQYHLRFLDRALVGGRQEPISLFEVLDGEPAPVQALKLQTLPDFEQGIQAYRQNDFGQAQEAFETVLATDPTDQVAALYLQRAKRFVEDGVPDDWDGVTRVMEEWKH